jgi:monoamine oxidase
MSRVIVVGAGVAGLAAARELTKHGFEPIVLEARDRCGGRILSVHDPLSPIPLELGAEFVHGVSPALWDLLHESGATVVEQEGEHLGSSDWDAMGKVFKAMASAPEQSFAEFIAGVDAPEGVKQSATGFVEGFNAALKEEVSVAWLNRENKASGEVDGDRSFRILNGYDTIPRYLARGLDIRYSTAVRRIRWTPGEAVAETNRREFHGASAIVTVPFGVLCGGGIQFEPEPEVLERARTAIGTGQAIRVTLRFREPVWEKHRRLSFLHGDAPFPVWWTQYPVHAPVITGWAAGTRALSLSGKSEYELIGTALRSLREILGENPGEPLAWYFHDWENDPWSRAAYSYVRVYGSEAQQELAQPVDGTLCFAGEAVAPAGHMGTVHGAIASGIAAARALAGYDPVTNPA